MEDADPMTSSFARENRDRAVVEAKHRRLRDAHAAPITALVERIREHSSGRPVPFVDPDLGGVKARILFVLETPARPAALGSDLLSPGNDDGTAANVAELYVQSGLSRTAAMHWNAVPWFLGTAKKNANARLADIDEGVPWLAELVGMLPDLELVVAMGEIAWRSVAKYMLRDDARLLPWLAVAHPSPRVRNTNPELWIGIERAFAKAAAIAG